MQATNRRAGAATSMPTAHLMNATLQFAGAVAGKKTFVERGLE
jgi:hypothetical protein